GAQAVTDSVGIARTSLIAGNQQGTALVQAVFGRTLTVSREVVFVAPVGSLTLSAQPRQILADALDSAIVVAQVRDQQDNPASSVRVFFTAPQGGRVSPSFGVSDEEGIVRSTYYGLVLERDSVVSVEATAEGGATGSVNITLQGVNLQMTANPQEISGNGYATSLISAHLSRTTDNVPLVRREIRFRSSAGLIGERAETDTLGRAQVRLVSPPREASVAVIAQYSDFHDTVIVRCLESIPAGGEIAVDPIRISIAGLGRNETARITLTVRDARGEPVPDRTAISLVEATRLGIRFPENADTASLLTANGQASVTVRSGYRTGIARFRALYSGQVLTEGGELVVEAGSAHRVRVFVDINAPRSLAGGFTALPVSAAVQDTFGNPVADSTRVAFSLVPDTLGQITSTGYTRNGMVLTEPEAYPAGIWLTFPDRFAGERLWVRAVSGSASDSTSLVLPGALQGGDPAEMEVEADSARLVADGVSTTIIRARIYDSDGRPVRDMTEVRFGAQLGRITSPRWTAGGVVETTYRSGQRIGVDTVTVSAGDVRGAVLIRLRPGPTHRITLTSLRDTLRANGIDQTTLIAQLYDRYDNPADAGRSVEFIASRGEITSPVLTDSSGRAVARLTSVLETGIALVTARSGEGFAERQILLVSGAADNIVLLSVDRVGIGIRGSGSPETANLIFEVRDDRGVPVDSLHTTTVRFILDGPGQVVDPAVAGEDSVAFLEPDSTLTDAQGRAAVTLRSGFYAGAVQITAEIPGVARGRAIAVTIFGGPPDLRHFTVLPSRCLLTGLEGTGPDTSNISVTLGDRFSNPVTPGTIVYFSATGGVIEGSARTDSAGQATVRLITTEPFPVEGVDTISAQTVDWQNQPITAQTRVLVTGRTRVRIEPSENWSIPFGGYQDFLITVADTFEHSLVAGTSIQVAATAFDRTGAEVTGLRLTGDGVEEPIVIGECSPRTRLS
ncbi:MAG: Ig-like domain-containing protein, partial [bacterium]